MVLLCTNNQVLNMCFKFSLCVAWQCHKNKRHRSWIKQNHNLQEEPRAEGLLSLPMVTNRPCSEAHLYNPSQLLIKRNICCFCLLRIPSPFFSSVFLWEIIPSLICLWLDGHRLQGWHMTQVWPISCSDHFRDGHKIWHNQWKHQPQTLLGLSGKRPTLPAEVAKRTGCKPGAAGLSL